MSNFTQQTEKYFDQMRRFAFYFLLFVTLFILQLQHSQRLEEPAMRPKDALQVVLEKM